MSTTSTQTPAITAETGTDGVTRAAVQAAPPAGAEKPQGDRPAWLPEGFNTPEDFAKAYADLKKGSTTNTDGTATSQTTTTTTLTPEQAAKAVTDAGLDMSKLSAEYAEKGQLSAETLQTLAAKGIDKATVDSYITGQQAVASQIASQLHEVVGGESNMKTMLEWGKSNLTQAEITAYDKAVTSGDVALAKMAVSGVYARYAAANGTEPRLVNGESRPTNTGLEPFKSNAEVVTAMSDKRYKTDPAYRAKVASRLNVSNVSNVRAY